MLRGAGERAFVGGADIGELGALDRDSARDFITLVHRCCDGFRRLPVPVIARIDGYALGGGLELAAACDLRVASERRAVRHAGGQDRHSVGHRGGAAAAADRSGRARRLVLTGETIGAAEALAWGLVDAVAPRSARAAVERFAAAILAGGPHAIRLQKADPRLAGNLDQRRDRPRHRRVCRGLRDRRAGAMAAARLGGRCAHKKADAGGSDAKGDGLAGR